MESRESFPVSINILHVVRDIDDDNVDVVVMLQNGERRTVTFYTLKNIERLLKSYEKSGECLSGKFFWAKGMVVAADLREGTIREIVHEMVRNGEFEQAYGGV